MIRVHRFCENPEDSNTVLQSVFLEQTYECVMSLKIKVLTFDHELLVLADAFLAIQFINLPETSLAQQLS